MDEVILGGHVRKKMAGSGKPRYYVSLELSRDPETGRRRQLANQAAGALAGRIDDPEAVFERLRKERDDALAKLRAVQADLAALRNVNQRLIVDNSRLLAGNGDDELHTKP